MPCTPFTLPGGARAIVCSRTPRPRCACGETSAYQCDARRGRSTCSRHLCAACATQTGPDTHLCPEHAKGPAQSSLDL